MLHDVNNCARLPAPVETRTVTSDDLDLNGHMNATHYFNAHVRSMRSTLNGIGFTEDYAEHRRMGTFAVEQSLRYLGELRLGNRYSTRVQLLERTDKAIHAMSFLVNESAANLSNIFEVVVVHVDQDSRRATGFPADLAARLDERIRAGKALDFDVPTRLSLHRRRDG